MTGQGVTRSVGNGRNPACVITGATGGIGAALAKRAAARGFSLVLHGRSEVKLAATVSGLLRDMPDLKASTVVGDLDSAAGAHQVAASLASAAPELDVLFNNAGVLLEGVQMSSDGLEMHTQVNLIAPYVLMRRLLNNVAAASGAIINVSSGTALRAQRISVDELVRPLRSKRLSGAYATSKLALAAVTRALGDEFAERGVALASATPGPIKSEMTAGRGMPPLLRLLRPFLFKTPEEGAARLFGALDRARSHPRAGAFFDGKHIRGLPSFATSEDVQHELIRFCQEHARLG